MNVLYGGITVISQQTRDASIMIGSVFGRSGRATGRTEPGRRRDLEEAVFFGPACDLAPTSSRVVIEAAVTRSRELVVIDVSMTGA